MKNILSIDIDIFWGKEETIYQNVDKEVGPDFRLILESLSKIECDQIFVGIDHHEICKYLDQFNDQYYLQNLDAHHDLYGHDFKSWLNPLFIRGKEITIGNFLLQMLREKSMSKMEWVIPNNYITAECENALFKQIGLYYSQKVLVSKLVDFKPFNHYNMIFISISPEWIPIKDLDKIISILNKFGISSSIVDKLRNEIINRWELGDNNTGILDNRFSFENSYK